MYRVEVLSLVFTKASLCFQDTRKGGAGDVAAQWRVASAASVERTVLFAGESLNVSVEIILATEIEKKY